jgi:hypothetical protein
VIGPDINLGVDDLAEGLAELNELLLAALPGQVAHVKHLRRGLRVAELRLTGGGRHGDAGRSTTAACAPGEGARAGRRCGRGEAERRRRHSRNTQKERRRKEPEAERGGEGKGREGEKGGERRKEEQQAVKEKQAREGPAQESQRRANEQRR